MLSAAWEGLEPRGDDRSPSAALALLANRARDTTVMASRGAEPTFDPDARFLVYSVTKTFEAAAALRLCAAGEL